MSVFSFPIGFCKEIDSILANFWWGHNQEANKIHWISWKDLGLPKKEGGMGFRSLRDFNTALLAKQCWRLMMEPDAFWAQLIKSRYFPNNDFLEAKKGARSSWAWSSLLAGRDVILNGARWQVLDGSRINLWTDKWIPCSPAHLLMPKPGVEVNEEEKVETIINPSNCVSNVNAIDRQVNVRGACLIKALPLGDGTEANRMVWPFNRDGRFTVKSGYNLIINASLSSNTSRPSGSWTTDKILWKSIWNSKLVPKLKNFLWRICKGCLSTCQALHRRHLGPSPLCPLCGEFPESEEHLLLLCNWVQGVWFGGPLCYKINRQSITTIGEWLKRTLQLPQSSAHDRSWLMAQIAYTCWCIWKSRCAAVFEGVQVCPKKTLCAAQSMVSEFMQMQSESVMNMSENAVEVGVTEARWSAPPHAYCKVNVDASWEGGSKLAGLGVVVWDSNVVCLGGSCKTRLAASAIEAEAHAALNGVHLATQMGISHVVFESDSKELVQSVKGHIQKSRWTIFPF